MKYFRQLRGFFRDIWQKRFLISQLTARQIKATYTGSLLGPLWILLEPLLYILILWFFFGVGLRGSRGGEVPFVVYLSSGLVSWFYFARTLGTSPGLIKRFAFLVKKVDFRLNVLPIVNILSMAVSHLVLLAVILCIAVFYGYYPSLFWLQLVYYFFAMCFLLLGLGWLTSSVNVFLKDTAKIVSLCVQFGFWLTPIFWKIDRVPAKYQYLIKANPMYYIVNGYRDSIVFKVPFWEYPVVTAYFWAFSATTVLLGMFVFTRLRPHFAHEI